MGEALESKKYLKSGFQYSRSPTFTVEFEGVLFRFTQSRPQFQELLKLPPIKAVAALRTATSSGRKLSSARHFWRGAFQRLLKMPRSLSI